MTKEFSTIPWERYADDGVTHCVSEKQAEYLKSRLEKRFKDYGLELNEEKTKIVYCKDGRRKGEYKESTFEFLGYQFRGRTVKRKNGEVETGFLPAISEKSSKAIREEVRRWKLQRQTEKGFAEIAKEYNPKIQGWINYYGKFYQTEMKRKLSYINRCLIKWIQSKYKLSKKKARNLLKKVTEKAREMFAHWKIGVTYEFE